MDKFMTRHFSREGKKKAPDYPLATIAFYGPTNEYASRVAVGIFHTEAGECVLEQFYSEHNRDVRSDEEVGKKVVDFIEAHGVRTILTIPGILR